RISIGREPCCARSSRRAEQHTCGVGAAILRSRPVSRGRAGDLMARHDPLSGLRFRVEIDGIASAAFSEVEIGETTTDVIDYREGSEPTHARKLPGPTRFGSVVLRRGVTTSLELVQWHAQIAAGQIAAARRNVVVVI